MAINAARKPEPEFESSRVRVIPIASPPLSRFQRFNWLGVGMFAPAVLYIAAVIAYLWGWLFSTPSETCVWAR